MQELLTQSKRQVDNKVGSSKSVSKQVGNEDDVGWSAEIPGTCFTLLQTLFALSYFAVAL